MKLRLVAAVVLAAIVAAPVAGAQESPESALTIVSADASQFPIVDVLVEGPRTINIEQINLSQDGIDVPTRLIDVAAPDVAVVVVVDPGLGPEIAFDQVGAFAAALDPAIAVGVQAGDLRQGPITDRVELNDFLEAARQSWIDEPPTMSWADTQRRGQELVDDQAGRFAATEVVEIATQTDFDPIGAVADIEARHPTRAVVRLVFPDELVDRYGGQALLEALVGPDGVDASGYVPGSNPAATVNPAAPVDPAAPVEPSRTESPELAEAAPPALATEPAPARSGSGQLRGIGITLIAAAIVIGVGVVTTAPSTGRVGRSAMAQVMGGVTEGRSGASGISAGLIAVADRMIGRSERTARLGPKLERAGIPMRPTEFVVIVMLITLAATLLGLSFLGPAFFLAPLLCLGAVSVVLQRMTTRRREKFADQLPGLLASMSGSLRAGNSLLQVLNQASREVGAPASDELQRVLAENRLGRDLADALRASVDRMEVDDYRWVVEAIDVNRSTGGDLTSVLDNVEETIRDRASIGRQVKALTAEGRISAKMLSALPFAMYGWQSIMNPEMAGVLLRTPMGRMIGMGALGLMAIGALWMRKIAQLKF